MRNEDTSGAGGGAAEPGAGGAGTNSPTPPQGGSAQPGDSNGQPTTADLAARMTQLEQLVNPLATSLNEVLPALQALSNDTNARRRVRGGRRGEGPPAEPQDTGGGGGGQEPPSGDAILDALPANLRGAFGAMMDRLATLEGAEADRTAATQRDTMQSQLQAAIDAGPNGDGSVAFQSADVMRDLLAPHLVQVPAGVRVRQDGKVVTIQEAVATLAKRDIFQPAPARGGGVNQRDTGGGSGGGSGGELTEAQIMAMTPEERAKKRNELMRQRRLE